MTVPTLFRTLPCEYCQTPTEPYNSVRTLDSEHCICMDCVKRELPNFYVQALEFDLIENDRLQ